MPVKINGYALTPAPAVTFSKNFVKTIGSGVIGAGYTIDLAGTIIAYKGNPEPLGMSTSGQYMTFSSTDDPLSTITDSGLLNTIMKKQEYIRNLVSLGQSSGSGMLLEITGYAESSGIKAYCDIENISFDDRSLWTNTCGYTISLSTNRFTESSTSLFGINSTEDRFGYYVSEASEDWSIQEQDTYTATTGNIENQRKLYNVSHNVSAVGQRVYIGGAVVATGSPIAQASGYVHNVLKLGFANMPSSFLPATGLAAYDRKVVESINELTGSYGIVEEFTLVPTGQGATESIQITTDSDIGLLSRIQVQGTITGLDSSGIQSQAVNKYANAQVYWAQVSGLIYTRVNAYAGSCSLNTVPLSTSIGRNFTEGIITYNYEYDNRPANILTGALSESIELQDTYPGQLINVVPVIGRSQPIIQYINSRSEYKRLLTVNAVMSRSGCTIVKPTAANMTTLFDLYKPVGTKVYYSPPTESFNVKSGAYSYTIEFIYEGPSSANAY
jgi:hypothetical protein